MRITRLELSNFRSISHLVLEDLPDTIVLVSTNGVGKSTILEAIAGAHDLVSPYHGGQYGFRENFRGATHPAWPQHFRAPVRLGTNKAKLSIEVTPSEREREFLRNEAITDDLGRAAFVIEDGRYVTESTVNPAIRKLFEFHAPNLGLGYLDYIGPIRSYGSQVVGDITALRG